MQFVDELPPDGRGGGSAPPIDVNQLRANAGQWAEVGRYPKSRRPAASSRGRYLSSLHDGLQYTTRTVGDETVVYIRAVSA